MKKIPLTILLCLALISVASAQSEKYPLQAGDEGLSAISEVSWSPNNDLILTASGEGDALRLWDVATGRLLWKNNIGFLQDGLENNAVISSDWTRDQRLILTGTRNGKVQLWEAATGRLVWNIKAHPQKDVTVAVSPDAKTFVSASETDDFKSELKLWSLSDGKLIRDLSADQKGINAIRYVADDRFQTGDRFGHITTWSTESPQPLATKQTVPCDSTGRRGNGFVYSPDFTFVAAQCLKNLVIKNVNTGRVVGRVPRDESSSDVSFSGDERKLLIPDSQIFDLNTGAVKTFEEFDRGALNRDGSLVASLSYSANGVQIFDTATGRRRGWLVGHPGVIKSLAFGPDGGHFASGGADRNARIWDARTRKLLLTLEGHTDVVELVAFSEDGKTLTTASEKETIVWNAETGAKIKEVKRERRFNDGRGRVVSPSGRLALVQEYDKPFRLVDAKTDVTIKEFVLIDQLDNLVFCPDEKHFLAKPWWGGWQLWSVEGGKPIREFDVGYSYYNVVAFSPDGRTFVTGGEGQNILMFDLETGETLWSLFPVDREEFEQKKAGEARRVASINRDKENARLADIENEPYADKVYITFDHYGDMTDPGQQRIVESGEPKTSKLKKPAEEANAVWLRLHNDSPLPVVIPTQSVYLPNKECFFVFPGGQRLSGLCDNREISVWFGLEDKDGKPIPYGFDFGSSAFLLPGKSVLFAVPREILKNGNAVRFAFKFQKPNGENKIENYGNEKTLRFRESELQPA
jgi:WD40 repeat protein